jgi:solute carrier family 45 protein 1/2/4
MLAIIVGGLQLSWSVEFSEGTPFLLSLGVSKDVLALIWIAGPLSGALGQPIIGIFSDNSENKSGRRKPFIIGGCIATSLSLLYLSHSVDLVSLFFPSGTDITVIKTATIPFAAVGVYVLDFSISAIQAASRAYIVDNVPTNQQQIANGVAAILIGTFNIIGYLLGSINLVSVFSFLGNTQFKILALVASVTLVSTSVSSLLYIKERDPTTDLVIIEERKKNVRRLQQLGVHNPTNPWELIVSLYKQTVHSIGRLSPQVKTVCFAEFFAWIGYFPMLFYTTTYVGEIYKYEFFKYRDPSLPPLTQREFEFLQETATRKGALALLLHSITSFLTDLLLPFLVQPFDSVQKTSELPLQNLNVIGDVVEKIRQKFTWWLSVRNAWYLSHILFIFCMGLTFLIRSSSFAIFMFALLGITWGTALWAPFVLISEEISRIKEIKANIRKYKIESHDTNDPVINESKVEEFEGYEHEAGLILGLHNFFVAAPQVISSLLSSVLFRFLSKANNDGSEFDSSLGWVFRFGGLATIGALVLSIKVKTNEEMIAEEDELFQAESNV